MATGNGVSSRHILLLSVYLSSVLAGLFGLFEFGIEAGLKVTGTAVEKLPKKPLAKEESSGIEGERASSGLSRDSSLSSLEKEGSWSGVPDKAEKESIHSILSDIDLANNYYNLIDGLSSAMSTSDLTSVTTSTSDSPMSTSASLITQVAVPTSEAVLRCNLYSNFTSLCGPPTVSLGSLKPTPTYAALSSCACYSATHYYAHVFASAATACGANTTAYISQRPSSAWSIIATSARPSLGLSGVAMPVNQMERFCAPMEDARKVLSSIFDQLTALTTTASETTASETTASETTASETTASETTASRTSSSPTTLTEPSGGAVALEISRAGLSLGIFVGMIFV
ncbi:hypothetical protein N7462_006648 [Penicillium macrosclerotiorum]|uniref:uncharacterized protein n=1 Tax=Penicillium macrosclerotiorum TaxID=303699 RepID=UPI0025489F5F|nr:uncharacterized protein N7462_006648 [Penicillium macrosclerotiorum]KAJ5683483.1 hypothetical protein N7462_006648 [Penicillium macrosclerotiorum]